MKNFGRLFVITVVLSVLFAIPAFADATFSSCWVQDASGNWKVKYPNGEYVTNAWFCDDAIASNGKDVWYLLDAAGNMISAGLVQDGTGNYYSLETSHNGYYGMLRYKSGTYDGVNLELESSHSGAFASIKNKDAVTALANIYGVKNVSINNSNCVYSSSLVTSSSQSSGSLKSLSSAQATTDWAASSSNNNAAAFVQAFVSDLNNSNTDPDIYYLAEGNTIFIITDIADNYYLSRSQALNGYRQIYGSVEYKEEQQEFKQKIYEATGVWVQMGIRGYHNGEKIFERIF